MMPFLKYCGLHVLSKKEATYLYKKDGVVSYWRIFFDIRAD